MARIARPGADGHPGVAACRLLPPPSCHGQSTQQADRTEDRGRSAHRHVVGTLEEGIREVPARPREQDERAADTRTQSAADGAQE